MAAERQDLKERAFRLASRVFKMFQELAAASAAHAYVARQMLRATASVGANLDVAPITQETDEFTAMLTVAVKKLRQPVQTPSALRVPLTSDL